MRAHDPTQSPPDAGDHDAVQELETNAQRRELEVRFAYEETLERRLLENQHEIELWQGRVASEAERARAEHQRLDARAAANREQAVEALRALADTRRERDDLRRERDDVRSELEAERQRISYRAVQAVVARLRKHPALLSALRTLARPIRG